VVLESALRRAGALRSIDLRGIRASPGVSLYKCFRYSAAFAVGRISRSVPGGFAGRDWRHSLRTCQVLDALRCAAGAAGALTAVDLAFASGLADGAVLRLVRECPALARFNLRGAKA
jgi:hypothetical protein